MSKKQYVPAHIAARTLANQVADDAPPAQRVAAPQFGAAHIDRHEPYMPERELAKNLLEIALRDALKSYKPNIASNPTTEQIQEAREFWMGEDCEPWVQIAGMSWEGVVEVRRRIQEAM